MFTEITCISSSSFTPLFFLSPHKSTPLCFLPDHFTPSLLKPLNLYHHFTPSSLQFNSPPSQSPLQFNSPSQQSVQFNSPPPQSQPYNIGQQQQQRIVQQQQNRQHQSLASHFHLLHLVENFADAIENGTRDQHSDALVNELNTHFEKCQQLLNSISSSISSKAMTVEGQKRKLEESDQFLNQRRDLISNYRSAVEELMKGDV